MEAPPRLRPRTHVITLGEGLLLRRGADALRLIEPADAALLRSVLAMLGEPVDDLLPDVPERSAPSIVTAMRMIDELAAQGFVVTDEVETWCPPPITPVASVPESFSGTIGIVGDTAARYAVQRVESIGGAVVWYRSHDDARTVEELPPADLIVACLDGPDLALLDAIDEWSGAAGIAAFPAFVLGDEAVLGPLRRPDDGGCLRCWELRWLGIIPSVVGEKAYLRHLRAGHWRHELPVDEGVAQWLGARAADEALAVLQRPPGAGAEVVVGDLRRASAGRHPLVRHPACDRCAPAYREPSRAEAEAAWSGWRSGRLDEGAAGPIDFSRLVDDRLGLVSPVEIESAPGDVLGIAVARFAIPHPHRLARDPDSASYGAGRDADEAALVAKVEGLERYCGLFLPPPSVEAAYADVRGDAVDPRSLPLYSERQYATPGFPRPRFDERLVLPWVWAHSLTAGRARLVPQPSVRFGGTEDDLVDETSSGVAAHATRARALSSALSELVERDAFMLFWLHRLVPLHVDRASVSSPFARNALAAVERAGYEPVLLDITSDFGVPVVLALGLCTDGTKPAFRLGAGCHVDPHVAVDKSLRELLGAVQSVPIGGWTPGEPMAPEDVRSLRDHSGAYAHPAWLARAEFLWSSTERRAIDDVGSVRAGSAPTEQVAAVVGALEAHGHEVLAADLTPPDVAGTIDVVRAIVPGLQPIGFGPFGLRLGGRRLYEAPVRMGYRTSVATEDELNPDPHCFP